MLHVISSSFPLTDSVLYACTECLYLQAFDVALNSAPFNVTIEFNLINDNMFSLLLDAAAGNVNHSTQFLEGQNYPGFPGTIPVPLFDRLGISDDDSGLNNLTRVMISFVGGMQSLICHHVIILYDLFSIQIPLKMTEFL